MRFDESDWIQNFLNRNESEFVGFKMFNGDTSSVTETAKRFDMKLIPGIEKGYYFCLFESCTPSSSRKK